MTSCSVTNH